MADRRTDDTPLAPRRPLGGSSSDEQSGSQQGAAREGRSGQGSPTREQGRTGQRAAGSAERRPLSDRVSAAIATASDAASGAASKASDAAKARRPETARKTGSTRPPRTRKARLRLTHLDPWSVMKTSFLLSIAFGIVTVVSVAVVWSVLGAAGVWDSINQTVAEVIGGESGAEFDIENYVGTSRVMGFTMIVAALDVVLITAVATLGAFLYNLAATLLGGLEMTLAEDDR